VAVAVAAAVAGASRRPGMGYLSKNWGFEIGYFGAGIEYTKHKDGQTDYEIDLQASGGFINIIYSFGTPPA
jgi:hypothetical protein